MLVISRSIVLSPAEAALPAGTPLIGWHNLVTAANLSADSEDADYPASNLANPATDLKWLSSSTALQYLTVAVNSLDDVDYVGIHGHNFATAGIAVSVGYFNDETSPATWVELVQEQIPPDDGPLILQFTPQSLATLKVKLAAGSEEPTASVLYVGKLLICERGVDINSDFAVPKYGRKTDKTVNISESGHYLGRTLVRRTLEFAADFKHFRPDWYREHFDPFVEAASEDTPFFYAWAPDDYPYEVAFAWLRADPVPFTNPITGRKRVQLQCGGIV